MSNLILGSLDENRLRRLILGRNLKWKDYIDLYFLIKDHISLEDLIKLSKQKFGSDFSEKLFLEQLVYWDDVNDYQVEFLEEKIPQDLIKGFLEDKVKEFKRETIGKQV